MKFSKLGLMSFAALTGVSFAFAGKTGHKADISHVYGITGETNNVYTVEIFNPTKRCDTITGFTCSFTWTASVTISTIDKDLPVVSAGKYQ